MVVFGVICGVLNVLFSIHRRINAEKEFQKKKKALSRDLKYREERLNKLLGQYGKLTIDIAWGDLSNQLHPNDFLCNDGSIGCDGGYVWCFEDSQIIIISKYKHNPMCFKAITRCDLSINNTISESTTYTTNSGSIGRAIIGGALAGGVGAIIGGTTGNSNSTTHTTNKPVYKVCLQLDDISSPNLIINLSSNENQARELYALISLIIKRMESGYYNKEQNG